MNVVKSTGIVRRVDNLGRVVLPMELRKTRGIKEKDLLEVFVEGDRIILVPYRAQTPCEACGHTNENAEYYRINVCRKCLNRVRTGSAAGS